MSSGLTRKRTRSQSACHCQGVANENTTVKASSPKSQRGKREIEDTTTLNKLELARTIAEFRVGLLRPSTSSTTAVGHASEVDIVDECDVAGAKVDERDCEQSADAKAGKVDPIQKLGSASAGPVPEIPAVRPALAATHPFSKHAQIAHVDGENPCGAPMMFTASACAPPPDSVQTTAVEPPSRTQAQVPNRKGFTASERELLEAAFHIADKPGSATMKLLVHLTGLEKKKIRGWFRTRRNRKERVKAKTTSTGDTSTSPAGERHQVPPQYWPEPLRVSHMQHPSHQATPFPAYPMPGCIPPVPPPPAPTMPTGHWYPPPMYGVQPHATLPHAVQPPCILTTPMDGGHLHPWSYVPSPVSKGPLTPISTPTGAPFYNPWYWVLPPPASTGNQVWRPPHLPVMADSAPATLQENQEHSRNVCTITEFRQAETEKQAQT